MAEDCRVARPMVCVLPVADPASGGAGKCCPRALRLLRHRRGSARLALVSPHKTLAVADKTGRTVRGNASGSVRVEQSRFECWLSPFGSRGRAP
jgi:hypothetical protein